MKITFLTPQIEIAGGVKIILGYADRLAKRGHNVTVICPENNEPNAGRRRILKGYLRSFTRNLKRDRPHWIPLSARLKFVPSPDEKFIPDADIIVASAWQHSTYVSHYSGSKGKKIYLFQHYERLWSDGCNDVDVSSFNLPLKKVVTSSALQDLLKKKHNVESVLVPVPVDLDDYYPARKKYNEDKIICMHYHTAEYKGFNDGIKAFETAKKVHPKIKLAVFGPGKFKGSIDGEYYSAPSSAQLREIYNLSDIFLCPSWREGFGLPSAEAMACRCALVTADTGGNRDFAVHEQTALVSPPKDVKALADNLIRILDDRELFERVAREGFSCIQKFSWKNSVDQFEKILLEL